jgi:hypothetical protein
MPLTKPVSVYNVDGIANDASVITDIADIILCYKNHSEHTQVAITRLGKQSLILGYNWLRNHNPEINCHSLRNALQTTTMISRASEDTSWLIIAILIIWW